MSDRYWDELEKQEEKIRKLEREERSSSDNYERSHLRMEIDKLKDKE